MSVLVPRLSPVRTTRTTRQSKMQGDVSYKIWIDGIMSVFCVLCAALASGLTIGLVSIDHNQLRLMMINGTQQEKAQAAKILPLIKDHHWLLVTLLLFNAIANEALPIFLAGIMPESVAVLVATFSVLVFGEIIPSTIFSGTRQLQIASSLSGFVRFLLGLFYIIARPVGLFLDWWLGKRPENEIPFGAKDLYTLLSLSRARNGSIVSEDILNPVHLDHDPSLQDSMELGHTGDPHHHSHSEHGLILSNDNSIHRAPPILFATPSSSSSHRSAHDYLDDHSVRIAQRAIVCSKENIEKIVKKDFIIIESYEEINMKWFERIGQSGFSRYPVRNSLNSRLDQSPNLLGYIVMKELFENLEKYLTKKTYVRDLPIHPVAYVQRTVSIVEAIHILQRGQSRIGCVTINGDANSELIGYFSVIDLVEIVLHEVHLDDE